MTKSIYILGINEAINSSAALLRDGEIIAAAQEERFNRIKNCWGFPKKAVEYCCKFAGIAYSDLDLAVLSYIDPYPHFVEGQAVEKPDATPHALKIFRNMAPYLEYKIPAVSPITQVGRDLYYQFYQPQNQQKQVGDIAKKLNLDSEKIIRIDHHLCHAYSAYYANPKRSDEKTLILTNDGAGDQVSAAVYVATRGKFKLGALTPHRHSLGLFYSAITGFLGLKAHEHEYKVMGLAPYAANADLNSIKEKFKGLVWVDGLTFKSSVPSWQYGAYLNDELKNTRFDWLAAATQEYFEELITTWVKNAVQKTKINNVIFSGGSFLNVKANKEILKIKSIKSLFFMPSPGDDTNAIGAAYFGFAKLKAPRPRQAMRGGQNSPASPSNAGRAKFKIKPISDLYLGPEFTIGDIKKALKKYKKMKVVKSSDIAKDAAKLLSEGKVVARFSGRMEMGARALGNRSILADPRDSSVIGRINKMIKMRDFWMPFTPTVLKEYESKYVKNRKKIEAPYMILSFDTTKLGRRDLAAAIHPYDKTTRPQILTEHHNPDYYRVIFEFERLTGVGAILNTSFNIHGEPIVCTPNDALSTFKRSGLKYLIMENLLIAK